MKQLQGFVEKRIQEIKKETEVVKQPIEERKTAPIYSGVLKYFPDAIKEVARCSYKGNIQHNPNKKLHWIEVKDELDATLQGTLLQAGTIDTDGVRHSVKVVLRALANLQKELEQVEG